jgi:hypothetical protein
MARDLPKDWEKGEGSLFAGSDQLQQSASREATGSLTRPWMVGYEQTRPDAASMPLPTNNRRCARSDIARRRKSASLSPSPTIT